MALYNQLAFGLLLLEIVLFGVLIVPLPFTWRRALFKSIAESPIIAKVQYALKITFIFVALLFADAVNHMLKLQKESALHKETGLGVGHGGASAADLRSRKFLSERNFYLHGFTLFLSLILSRTYSLVLDLIKAQEELAVLKAQGTAAAPGSETEKLVQLQKDYDQLSAKYATKTATVSDKRLD